MLSFFDIHAPHHEGGYYLIEEISLPEDPKARALERRPFGAAHSLAAARDLLPSYVQRIPAAPGCVESWGGAA